MYSQSCMRAHFFQELARNKDRNINYNLKYNSNCYNKQNDIIYVVAITASTHIMIIIFIMKITAMII